MDIIIVSAAFGVMGGMIGAFVVQIAANVIERFARRRAP